jgi:uncharacterized protein (DUF169 family)
MTDYARLESVLTGALNLQTRPVAVATRETPVPGVSPFTGSVPSGCTFWRLAADGRTFSTVPGDHYNCPIGSHTHNIPLPAGRAHELGDTLALMVEIGYIRMEEVPGIPQLPRTPGVVVYAPLGDTPVDPDVVILRGLPGRLMLLNEAAARIDVGVQPLFGRPTCMAIPAAMGGTLVNSTGCIGNRIYTDVPDSEIYTVVSGGQLAALADALAQIVTANAALTDYHTQRRATLTA